MPTNLHLGCLDKAIDGWTNTDITPHIFVARMPGAARLLRAARLMKADRFEQHQHGVFERVRYLNVGRRFPMADQSVDNVFSAHMLEHLPRAAAANCMREVHRVLKSGGILRVSIPDLDKVVASYDRAHPEKLLTAIYEPGHRLSKNSHHWMYNEHSLGRLLRDAGFSEVYRCELGQGRCPDLDRLDDRPETSLFMEAVK
jgi:SAM-dependent methyltransferase